MSVQEVGFNKVFVWLGLSKVGSAEGKQTLSAIIGSLVIVLTMFFATVEASRLLGFSAMAALDSQFMAFVGNIIFGLTIFGIGLYLANFVSQKVLASETSQGSLHSMASRIFIMVLAGAMALRQMGLANEVINIALGVIAGAIAVAVAIAFGMGSCEIAGRKLEERLKSKKSD